MNADAANQLDAWVREELSLDSTAVIEIAERPGTGPRCSPVVIDVTITAPGDTAYSVHIEHPLDEVTRMDFVAALAFGGH